ncbi:MULTISPECIES: hypothetical protein [unclassified Campylobacter]|uniref:hypothetical protein n=1 Tax=unclassified Campylobacter TaxID=2593542 RepID=UPI0022E9B2A5|nr:MULTISPECIES: hypothetical protein [unclassified Campylobacter]MDA3079034.1 hypothetical protein [Campylobacter sp. CS_NA2]MDA3080675.1 hypothetical protein [Campylobacter sp. CS_NA1]MDA3085120.1 hypothetical protein [Campylobacter sp. CS_ED1]MDA3089897.1 hypothetical protein [Campylobacter sp. CS_ED2]WBR51546.1 hypothetical protein PF026_01510 [Campylobacter sp. CS_NA3]
MKQYDDTEYQQYRKAQIKKWITNGMSETDAEQLMYEKENDLYSGDDDMDIPYDYTIVERAEPYGGIGLTEEELVKYSSDN